jgi:hypothetical protein
MRKLTIEIDDRYANAIGMTFIGGAGDATINIYTTTVNLTDKELVGFRLVDDCGKVRMIGKYKEGDRS